MLGTAGRSGVAAWFGQNVQFDAAVQFLFAGSRCQLPCKVDCQIRADPFVLIADDNPDRAAGELFGLGLKTQRSDKRRIRDRPKLPESCQVGDGSETGRAFHSPIVGGEVDGQKTAAGCAARRDAFRVGDA